MHTGSAAAARQILRAAGASAHITTAGFFTGGRVAWCRGVLPPSVQT